MKASIIFLLLLTNLGVCAQWNNNPSINNAVCNFSGNQTNVQIVADGTGGAIMVWQDTRNSSTDIYAQRISATGTLLWNADGVPLCTAAFNQLNPKIVTDGSGGAVIAWIDDRNGAGAGNYDIYAQRINSNGIVQWPTDGAPVCTATGIQNNHQILADNSGAMIVWSDGRGGSANADIYAQRLNQIGTALWALNGVPVCTASSLQNMPQIISDGGAGSAIITWEDWRNFSQSDIYAQKISNGFTNWTFNGVVICSEPNLAHQYNTKMVADGAGGAIICWLDQRNFGSGQDIYAQNVNLSGLVQWVSNGVVVCNATALQTAQQMIADGTDGAILSWEDRRSGQADIYSQRLNTSGAAQWIANGIAVCSAGAVQNEAQIVRRASGGATIIWTDLRNSSQEDIYAQAVTLAGAVLWTANGVPVANESHSQSLSHLISDGSDGAIIAWQDLRSTLNYDIYSSNLFANGTLPVKLNSFTATLQHKKTLLQWQIATELDVAKYNIQRSLDGNSFIIIGSVNSTGNSTTTKDYSYTDTTILNLSDSKIYYRLQIVDIDGKITYSKIEVVKQDAHLFINIMPNPAQNYIHVSSSGNIKKLSVINSFGQTVKVISSNENLHQQSVDISELPSGYYIIKAVGEKGTWTKQFIKQ